MISPIEIGDDFSSISLSQRLIIAGLRYAHLHILTTLHVEVSLTLIEKAVEFGRWIGIAGLKDVNTGEVKKLIEESFEHLEVQFFDADYVATWRHLFFAVLNALKAFRDGANFSKNIATESLLYASTQRQIEKAIEMLGIRSNTRNVAAIAVGEDRKEVESFIAILGRSVGTSDDTVLNVTEKKLRSIKQLFDLTQFPIGEVEEGAETEAVVDVLIEKMALLAVKK